MSSVSNALAMGQLEIAVARKQLDAIEQQGRDALKLIAATEPPSAGAAPQNVQPGVGTQLNFVG